MSTPKKVKVGAQLRCVGFCGVDDSVEPSMLVAVSARKPWVEWGVLFRPEKAGQPRYASDAWMALLREANATRKLRLAAHLCSSRADELLQGDFAFAEQLSNTYGFQRVQLNATKSNGCTTSAFGTEDGAVACVDALRKVCAAVPKVEFILQRNTETSALCERLASEPPSNLSMLFDDSMGNGKGTTSWPAPPPSSSGLRFGYAGGLSPANLSEQLALIDKAACGRTLWIDMESSLRLKLANGGDAFDVNKVMACVKRVCEQGMEPACAPVGDSNIFESSHPLILHKITQMRKGGATPKYLNQLMKEVSTLLCYEATAAMRMKPQPVTTKVGDEIGARIAERVGIVPVLRGGLGMVESMTEMVSNAQVWHLGIYRDKTSLLPIEYYNKLPKKVTVHSVYVLDPMPITGATAVAAMDILKAWGEGLRATGQTLKINFVCIVAAQSAIDFIQQSHPDVSVYVGLIDKSATEPVMPGMGDIGDRLFGTDPEDATPIDEEME